MDLIAGSIFWLLPVPSFSASNPPGPKLLLRDFLPGFGTFADDMPFSWSNADELGICAIDLRARRGLCAGLVGADMVTACAAHWQLCEKENAAQCARACGVGALRALNQARVGIER